MDELIIKVSVKTNKKKEEIKYNKEKNIYEVFLKSKPVNGKANQELIKLLKKHFKAKKVEILSGLTSHIKLIKIINKNEERKNN